MGASLIIDEFEEAFMESADYFMVGLYSGYDQSQLALQNWDLTAIQTPLGLVRMCTLPRGATNSVAHEMSGMNKM